VQDGNLYTVNNDGTQLYTLDGATGRVRWHDYLAPVSLLNAPLVADGVVYVGAGNFLYALNEQNGETIWKQTVPVWGSFAAAYLASGVLYVTNVTDVLQAASQNGDVRNFFAYNAQTGRLLWAAEPGYGTLFNLPITSGLLLAAREYNGVYSIGGLDPQTGRVAWQVPFQCAVSQITQQKTPTCGADWTAIINGKFYVLESASQTPNKAVYTVKSFDPGTGQLLSAFPLTVGQNSAEVVGASNGLLYVQIGVSKTANDLPPVSGEEYEDFLFAAYRLRDGSLAWSHAMPLFPPPNGTSANTNPNTSQPVLVP
jgi:outer membrane protein assembly factor BamB